MRCLVRWRGRSATIPLAGAAVAAGMKANIVWIGLWACGGASTHLRSDAAPDTATSAPITVPIAGCAWSFTGQFSIGDAPFRLRVDTGSAPLAVAGAGCTE